MGPLVVSAIRELKIASVLPSALTSQLRQGAEDFLTRTFTTTTPGDGLLGGFLEIDDPVST